MRCLTVGSSRSAKIRSVAGQGPALRTTLLGLLALACTSAIGLVGLAVALAGDEAPPRPSTPPVPWTQVAVVKLHEAVAKGRVKAWGTEPGSYQSVRLHLRNRSAERLAIDIAGSHLEPTKRRSSQRLGIGPAVTPSSTTRRGEGTTIVELEPLAETDFRVQTCCLDAGLPSPNRHEFEGADKPLPEVREKVLRWWADNPTAPQYAVNVAIWNFAAEVRIEPGVVPGYTRPQGRFAAVHRGMLYRVVDGVLTTWDADGIERILGAEVFQVLPSDDGIYAVALDTDRKPWLFLVPTTAEERWKKVLELDGTNRLREVYAAGKGNLVLVTDRGVTWFDAATKQTRSALESEQQDFFSVRRASAERMTVTLRRPGSKGVQQGGEERFRTSPTYELWTLDLATGKAEQTEKFWNVGAMLAGPGGVFALSHTQGRLRRVVGEKFTDLGPETEYRKILAAAGDVVWLVDPEDRVVAVDAKSGALRFRTKLTPEQVAAGFDVDPATGDLACVIGETFQWVHAKDGREESVATR